MLNNDIKVIRIEEGCYELEQVIIILTVNKEIVRCAKALANFFYETHTRYGNFDGQGFVDYLNSVYGEGACQLLPSDVRFTI